MTSAENPERLLIALEPEAASVYVRTLRLYQLVPDSQVNNQGLTPRSSRSSWFLNEEYLMGSSNHMCISIVYLQLNGRGSGRGSIMR